MCSCSRRRNIPAATLRQVRGAQILHDHERPVHVRPHRWLLQVQREPHQTVLSPLTILCTYRDTSLQLEKQGVCEDLDVKTLALSPFGTQQQFKDTPACHKLVWNFHCLSWVTTTFHRNVNGTSVSCAATGGSAMVPLPPCRSLCVEVADRCVYSHFYRMYLDEVCGNIACLTETQEAKDTGSTDTNVAEATCVSGSWVYAENKTFSRCSTRAYDPPVAVATRHVICKTVSVISVVVLWLV
ncbi:uncharacterized protein PITG_11878 [Phytophthora infestans T30-4]|uniref:FZ domain-containing protein n=1 Tax=Phytophthora infestans (strain T30-4) TaxID=403677 RepID=D0NHG0_PHYIT|nr:uncharacterized protein PITG_11878 [Phytophthora infestans T30-4]EEY58885.1 conserved hypothetical protein [Phytophthora infestans T30-4]|eukprot:XP_002901358.1 conserved hypothetical protein [Phytophthora infestans T30-4]